MGAILARTAGLFEAATRVRAAAYGAGLLARERVPGLAVLSVGGLSTGGEGKTPLAMHLAAALRDRGVPTALVSRGYRGLWERGGGVVSDGHRLLATAELAGDEALLAALRLEGVPVVVGADRLRAATLARELGARVAVLDSGFQHLRLARDLDVAIVSPAGVEGRVLPAGTLREPLSALGRADLLAFSEAPAGAPLPARGFAFELVPEALVDAGLRPVEPPEALAGRRVLVLAGIARPERVARAAEALGARVVARVYPGDHARCSAELRRALAVASHRAGAELVLTTEKDLVRLGPVPARCLALRLGVVLGVGGRLVETALDRFCGR